MLVRRTIETSQGSALYQDTGVSDEAREIERRTVEALRQIQSEGRRAALSELIDRFEACGLDGWDGELGVPMSAATYANARDFVAALPAAFPTPEVAIAEDGSVSFDWFPGPGALFSVSVTAEGKLFFAAVTPDGRSSGIQRFDGRLPEVISTTLRRLF